MCHGAVENKTDGDVSVKGTAEPNKLVMYWHLHLFILIIVSQEVDYHIQIKNKAFDRSPNVGAVKSDSDGNFEFKIKMPSAYYVGLGTLYIPQVHIKVCGGKNQDSYETIKLNDGIHRTLHTSTTRKESRDSPLFLCFKITS